MTRLVGAIAIFAALVMLGLTAFAVRSGGGLDVLTVTSGFVVVLLLLAGIGAVRHRE